MPQDDSALLSRLQSHKVDFVIIGGVCGLMHGVPLEALERSVTYHLSYGEFRILSIDALIAAKEAVGRERDKEAVRYLRAIKERNEQQRG